MNGPELELRDIHLPADSLWWPPAPGWWLLLLLAALAVAGLLWWRRRRRTPPLSRLSMQELERVRRDYRDGVVDRQATVGSVARLLRRVLIAYRGRDAAAASTGDAWLAQLVELAPQQAFDERQLQWLARQRYRPNADCDVEALLAACEDWMRSLPGEPRHAAD
jgi:hypothetical protein